MTVRDILDYPTASESGTKLRLDMLTVEHLKTLDEGQLRTLRGRLDTLLPRSALKDINLEEEAVAQLAVAKRLQAETLVDFECPANQKAQVLNTTASAIQSLVKMQVDLKRDEQLKRMEAALMKAIAELDEDARNTFFTVYETLAINEGVEVDG